MKVGIITIHNASNYGASLQSYALYRYIVNQGVDCEIIDLYRPDQVGYIFSERFDKVEILHPKRKLKGLLKKLILSFWGIGCKGRVLSDEDGLTYKFEEFNGRIHLSKPYRSIDQLYTDPPQYDLYITGSDQVWNPTQPYAIEPYFLTFVQTGRKISYASSIGVGKLSADEKAKFKHWLSSYERISVREHEAKILLESFVGRKIEQVPDPTFLLTTDEWRKEMAEKQIEEDYILCFTLYFKLSFIRYAIRIAKQSGKKLVILSQTQPKPIANYLAVKNAGPREWLSYIAYADMVLTDSFHCTVFSIILRTKNFYSYISPTDKRGGRIIGLLDTYGLKEHLLNSDLTQSFADLKKNVIEWERVENIQNREFLYGNEFLKNCLIEKQ